MGKINFKKLGAFIAFFVLAAVSCWATQESIHLLLPAFPKALCWIVTITFFVIASLGTKLIVDSFDSNLYIERRGLCLMAGIGLVLVFWLFFSMPTNTHTFFYRNAISSVASDDINTTETYLAQLQNNTVVKDNIKAAKDSISNAVDIKLTDLETEIDNEANPGFGPKSKRILAEFANLLHVANIAPISYKSNTHQQRLLLKKMYRQKIYALRDSYLKTLDTSMQNSAAKTYMSIAKTEIADLELYQKAINDGDANYNNADDITDLDSRLTKGYSTIRNYQDAVRFQDGDRETYIPADGSQQVTKVKKMLSVFDVWKDFLKGKYKGQGLIIWVILSILVDLGAFIFFDIAFKKDEYDI